MIAPDCQPLTRPIGRAELHDAARRERCTLRDTGTAVVPVDVGDPLRTLARFYALRAAGRVPLITPPRDVSPELPDLDGDLVSGADVFAVSTSGSTGRPRAVVRRWVSWSTSFTAFGEITGIGPDDVVLVPGPLSSSLFLFAAVHAVECGARVLPTGRWQPAVAASALTRATAVYLTPSMLAGLLARAPEELGGRKVVCAGAPLPASMAERAATAGAVLTHYYGAAELSLVAVGTHQDDLRPFPGVTVDVRDHEIWVRSPFVAAGYLGATGPLRSCGGGWRTVGDRGRLLADGRLRIDGRGERLVLTGGASVVVDDVERALREAVPDTEIVVVGLPRGDLGEVVTAVLEVPDDTRLSRAGLRRLASTLLDPTHRPRQWLVVPELPRTDGGKVARARLRAGLCDGTLAVQTLR